MARATRRNFVLTGVAATGALAGSLAGAKTGTDALTKTPAQTAGPFYPESLPLDSDNDLVQIEGRAERAKGEVVNLIGHVCTPAGEPIPGSRVEIWQCDANGRYHHSRDTNSAELDENFQSFGFTTTDADGRYRFRTIKPVSYPGRTPHIHAKVILPDATELTTQLYVRGEPQNERDGLFNRLGSDARKQAASADFKPDPNEPSVLLAQWDIVVG